MTEDKMVDDITEEGGGEKKTVFFHVREKIEWIPQEKATDMRGGFMISDGIIGFEVGEHEKLVDVGVMNTQQTKHLPMVRDDGLTINVPHVAYAMQTIWATQVEGSQQIAQQPVPASRESEDLSGGQQEEDPQATKSGIVMP